MTLCILTIKITTISIRIKKLNSLHKGQSAQRNPCYADYLYAGSHPY
jgi:hypothetical protein